MTPGALTGLWTPQRVEALLGIVPPAGNTFTVPVNARNVSLSFTDASVAYLVQTQVNAPAVYAQYPAGVGALVLWEGPIDAAVGVRVYAGAGAPTAILEYEI